LIYNQRYSQYNTKQNRLCFSRHLRILRYEQLKEFSKLLMFCLWLFAQSIGLFACIVLFLFSKSSSLFIEDLRDVENLARYINLSSLKLWFFTIDLLPDLIFVLWRTNFKFISLEKKQCLQQCYCYPCLDVETKLQRWWLQSSGLYTSYIVLCQLWWSSFRRDASDDHCFWWRVFRSSSSNFKRLLCSRTTPRDFLCSITTERDFYCSITTERDLS